MMLVRGENGVTVELLHLWTAPRSKVLVGDAVTEIYTWRKDGRIAQTAGRSPRHGETRPRTATSSAR